MSRLTLTFDNGPFPGATERILGILAERRLRATFFVVGDRLADSQAMRCAEQAWSEGHWIGNHTMTHGVPLGHSQDPDHCENEIAATERLLTTLAHPDKLFRPHGKGVMGPHLLSRGAARYLAENRYTVVTWNNVPRDWIPPHDHWVEAALSTLDKQDWSVLVLHDHALAGIMETLPRFLDAAEARGVEIVQQFPEEYILMQRGEARPALELYTMPDTATDGITKV